LKELFVSTIPTGTVGASRCDAHVVVKDVSAKIVGECARHFGERAAEAGRQLGDHAVFWRVCFWVFAVWPVRRMRYFLLMCLGMFMVVQALGRTQLSDESPEVNSENLLVLLIPLVFCYGVSFFFTFMEQMKLPGCRNCATPSLQRSRPCRVANDLHILVAQSDAGGLSALFSHRTSSKRRAG